MIPLGGSNLMTRFSARSRALPVLAVAVVALLGACSSSGGDSAASPTPDPCAALQTLQGSIQSLLGVQPLQQGTDAVKTAADQVGADLSAAATAVGSDLAPETDALKQAVQAMSDTISNAGTAGAAATATALVSELPAVGTAWTNLTTAAGSLNCDLATPSA